jgi:glycosyltransferase involved in cell wall biosynthesis
VRILVVTVVHDPEDARIRHRQIPALLAAGNLVTYAAPFSGYRRQPPAEVVPVDLPRATGRRRLGSLRAARRLLRTTGRRHDVVLLHDPELLLAVAGQRRRLGRAVVVWDVHEDTAAALGMKGWLPGLARRALPRLVHALERWAERHLRLLLAEERYTERFGRPHPLVPNSIHVPDRPPHAPGADRVVYLGRLTRARGAEELAELGRLLRGDGITVEVIGNTDREVADLLSAAAERGDVVWRGFLPNSEALPRLCGALAGVSLLRDEPNYAHSRPTKVMEYMAHGVPVVTTPNAASVELVEQAGCGFVVPFEDAAGAAAAIRRLAADPGLRQRLGHAGWKTARDTLSWDADGPRFAALLEAWALQ